ncbi:MAG: hypothetical protein ABJH52_08290 [Henriciella sp.]
MLIISLIGLLAFVSLYVINVRKKDGATLLLVFSAAIIPVLYCSLPVVFFEFSNLGFYQPNEVFDAHLMHAVYLVLALAALRLTLKDEKPRSNTILHSVSFWFEANAFKVGIVTTAVYFIYISQTSTTIYAVGDADEFIQNTREGDFGILGAISSLAMATAAMSGALLLRQRRLIGFYAIVIFLVITSILGASSFQRQSALTPVFFLLACFTLTGQLKAARRILIFGAVLFAAASPVIVYFREASTTNAELEFTYESVANAAAENDLESIARSMTRRADLIENTINLQHHFDKHGFVDPYYYSTILTVPVPRRFMPNKPTALSDDGTLSGEISILAWSLERTGNGSLTAFGAITAYRQGGWVFVFADAILLGLTWSVLIKILGRSSFMSNVFFIIVVNTILIKKAPASFLETIVATYTLLPFFVALLIVDSFIVRGAKRRFNRIARLG